MYLKTDRIPCIWMPTAAAAVLAYMMAGFCPEKPAGVPDLNDEQIEEMAVRITALRLCNEQNLRTVFSFEDVPLSVRRQAEQQVQQMPPSHRKKLFEKTVTARFQTVPAPSVLSWTRCGWAVAASAFTAGITGLLIIFQKFRKKGGES